MAKSILCHCEDIELEELHSALAQGYGDLETLKRYTGIGTGKCQGKCCLVQTLRVLATLERTSVAPVGGSTRALTGDPQRVRLPTLRPPVLPLRIDDIVKGAEEER
jgi:bacterioferritin-associated ferredoxin